MRPTVLFSERARNTHPRLFCGRREIDALLARRDEPNVRAVLDATRARAEQHLQRPLLSEEYANAAMTQHGNFYELGAQMTAFAEDFGLLYALGETRYTDKMIEALLHYAAFSAWTGPANRLRRTPWLSDLSTTRLLYAFAVAYDFFYDALTEQQRATVRSAMWQLGIVPLLADWTSDARRIHAMDSMGHNWWAVCTAFAGIGLCAIYEEIDAWRETLSDIVHSLAAFCDYRGDALLNKVANFDAQGMFYESTGYFNYGAGELCRFLLVLRRCFDDGGASAFPILPRIGDAYLSLVYPVSAPERHFYLNFGDSALRSSPEHRDGMTMLPQYLLLLGLGSPALQAYYARAIRQRNWLDVLYPAIVPEPTPPPVSLPAVSLYPDTGLAMWRSGEAVDGVLFALRCGFTWNHAHDDAGTFVLLRHGEAILCDSGTVSYGKSDYISHYCAAEAHNVVTINGSGQHRETLYRGNKFPGRLLHAVEDAELCYLLADATGPMCDRCMRNHRSFLRLGEDIFVTVDELYTYDEARFSYLLHHAGEAEPQPTGDVVTIRTERNALTVHTVSPEPHTLRCDEYEGLRFLAVDTLTPSRLCRMIHVIAPCERAVRVEAITGDQLYGATIRAGEVCYRLVCNQLADGRCMHINSNHTLCGYDTDAYLLCEREAAGEARRVLMVYGSYLRTDGRSCFEDFTKQTKLLTI